MSLITVTGKIWFDPVNATKKHEAQASWKVVAMIVIYGEYSHYSLLEK
jgi:hypothetical protein